KTTFTSETAKQYTNKMYFNYDIVANKKTLIEKPTFFEEINRKDNSKPFIILDEIHTVYSWNESGYGKFSLHFIKNKARLCVNYKQFVKSKLLTYLPDPLF
ncbi:MAG: hypothetical protein NT091_04610, partial [Candidatus Falkowbacteria bacterium]|nr:hypothetical protein [Candidatus Falkowbacteria bacterium]